MTLLLYFGTNFKLKTGTHSRTVRLDTTRRILLKPMRDVSKRTNAPRVDGSPHLCVCAATCVKRGSQHTQPTMSAGAGAGDEVVLPTDTGKWTAEDCGTFVASIGLPQYRVRARGGAPQCHGGCGLRGGVGWWCCVACPGARARASQSRARNRRERGHVRWL